ncbi:unnamed protein product, partial [Ectocarpus sp. 12 AP-2014]
GREEAGGGSRTTFFGCAKMVMHGAAHLAKFDVCYRRLCWKNPAHLARDDSAHIAPQEVEKRTDMPLVGDVTFHEARLRAFNVFFADWLATSPPPPPSPTI